MIAQAHNFPTGPALLDDPLFRAAEHRAKGFDWDQTAKHLDMDCRTLRLLTFAEPERWKKLSREAEREYFRETGRQSVSFMRALMPARSRRPASPRAWPSPSSPPASTATRLRPNAR